MSAGRRADQAGRPAGRQMGRPGREVGRQVAARPATRDSLPRCRLAGFAEVVVIILRGAEQEGI
eukprot:179403-Chlamydomonas_euryale.AAC.1